MLLNRCKYINLEHGSQMEIYKIRTFSSKENFEKLVLCLKKNWSFFDGISKKKCENQNEIRK